MKSGKYALTWPVALIRRSNACWISSQMAYPYGRIAMQPLTSV